MMLLIYHLARHMVCSIRYIDTLSGIGCDNVGSHHSNWSADRTDSGEGSGCSRL